MAILNHKSRCLLLLVALPLAQVLVVGCSSEEESLTEFKVVEETPSPNDVAQQNNIPLPTPADTSNTNPANDTLSTTPAVPAPGQPNLLQAVAQQANLPIPTKDSSVDAIQQFISILIQIPPQGQSQQRQLQFGILVSDELQALAEMLLSKEGLTETERRYGYEIKNTAVGRLYRLGHPKALSMQLAVANEMITDEYGEIVQEGKLLAFMTTTQKRLSEAQGKGEVTTAAESIREEAIGWIQGNESDAAVFTTLQQIGLYLAQIDPETGNTLLNTLGEHFATSEDKEIARNAKAILEQPVIDESGLIEAARDYTASNSQEPNSEAMLASLTKVLANPERGLGTFQILTQIIQSVGQKDAALSFQMIDMTSASYQEIKDQELATELLDSLSVLTDQLLVDHFKIRDAFRFYLQIQTSQGKQDILTAVTGLLNHDKVSIDAFGFMGGTADQLADQHPELVRELMQIILTASETKLAEDDQTEIKAEVTKTLNRINLVGSTLSVAAQTIAGEKFDWTSLRGNVVVVDFWATWCAPCLAAIPHLEKLQQQYAPQGVQFIGFSIDADRQALSEFMKKQELKWPVIIDDIDIDPQTIKDDPVAAAWDMPSTTACGINGIPALLILDRNGKVVQILQSALELEAALAKITSEPVQTESNKPAGTDSSSLGNRSLPNRQAVPRILYYLTQLTIGQAADEQPADLLTGNPYLAPADADKSELLDYLLDMQDKVKSIRQRDGFAVAVHDAAQRMLALEASDRFHILAVETACSILREQAALGNEQLDTLLDQFITGLAEDKRPAIQDQVQFHRVERQVLAADDLDMEQLKMLLDETYSYLDGKKLRDTHLRLASTIVHAINRYDDGEIRKVEFLRFGKLFSQSESRTLAAYGKKISKSATAPLSPSKLVGQQLELAGVTDLGAELNWKSYRGKIVLIDFWASWCAPCRAQMPIIKALYEELDRKQFDVVAVNLDRDEKALAEYFKEHQSPWPNIIGVDGRTLAEKYNVTALPTMMVVDREGKILGVGHSVQTLRPIITAALKK